MLVGGQNGAGRTERCRRIPCRNHDSVNALLSLGLDAPDGETSLKVVASPIRQGLPVSVWITETKHTDIDLSAGGFR